MSHVMGKEEGETAILAGLLLYNIHQQQEVMLAARLLENIHQQTFDTKTNACNPLNPARSIRPIMWIHSDSNPKSQGKSTAQQRRKWRESAKRKRERKRQLERQLNVEPDKPQSVPILINRWEHMVPFEKKTNKVMCTTPGCKKIHKHDGPCTPHERNDRLRSGKHSAYSIY